jgi:hypothetical protein
LAGAAEDELAELIDVWELSEEAGVDVDASDNASVDVWVELVIGAVELVDDRAEASRI